jgi:hypothetical protein
MRSPTVDTKRGAKTNTKIGTAAVAPGKPSSDDMSDARKAGVWKTKFGPRRVRHDPPTLEEAIIAASGLTDDASEQAEIAASLMGVPAEQVTAAMKVLVTQQRQVETVVARGTRGPRSVVVERKPARRFISTRPADR